MTDAGYNDIRRWATCRKCGAIEPVNAPARAQAIDIICDECGWQHADLHDTVYRCACGGVADTSRGGVPCCGYCYEHPDAHDRAMVAE